MVQPPVIGVKAVVLLTGSQMLQPVLSFSPFL